MTAPTALEEARTRYLLGLASEDEREAIEGEFFAEDESFERLKAAEDRLFDAFAAGGMPPAEAAAFRRRYLAFPEGQERLAFAKALRQRADESTVQPERVPRTVHGRAAWAGWAAALAAVVTSVWLAAQNARLRGEVDRLREATRSGPPPLSPHPPDPRTSSPSPPGPSAVVRFVRLPTQAPRGPVEVALPPGTRTVQLEVPLSGDEDGPTFRAVIRGAGEQEVWREEGLAPAQYGAPLIVRAPADVLPAGDYVLSVEGEPSRDAPQGSARRYRLRLVR